MNIYDIAREAGVSIATVSRVLNHKDTVRADTRAKVEKVLKRCNYAPSAIAQGMVSKSLHTVAVLTVDIRDSHYARTAYTIEREFGRRGYEVILCNTGGDRAETLRTLQAVAQKQVDGLILVGSIFNTICQGAERIFCAKCPSSLPTARWLCRTPIRSWSMTAGASRWPWSIW